MTLDVSGSVEAGAAFVPQYSARTLAEMLHDGPPDEVQYPTAAQQEIIEGPLEPLLVVAGAGSGKTKTMADRVVWLVANKLVAPEQILGVTFTRKAAGELASRIRGRLRLLERTAGGGRPKTPSWRQRYPPTTPMPTAS